MLNVSIRDDSLDGAYLLSGHLRNGLRTMKPGLPQLAVMPEVAINEQVTNGFVHHDGGQNNRGLARASYHGTRVGKQAAFGE